MLIAAAESPELSRKRRQVITSTVGKRPCPQRHKLPLQTFQQLIFFPTVFYTPLHVVRETMLLLFLPLHEEFACTWSGCAVPARFSTWLPWVQLLP